MAARPECDRGRRTLANVDDGRSSVGHPGGKRAEAAPPAIIGATHEVKHPRRPVPRQTHVPLNVGIIGEHLSIVVESQAKGIAQPAAHQLPTPSLGIRAHHMARRQLDGITPVEPVPRQRKPSVIRRVRQHRLGRESALRRLDVVAVNGIKEPVRAEGQLVATVPDPARSVPQQPDVLKPPVPVRVAQSIQRMRIVGIGIDRIVSPEQSAHFLQCLVRGRCFRTLSLPRIKSKQAPIFARHQHSPRRIKGHRHPGPLPRPRRAHQLHFKSVCRPYFARGRHPASRQCLLPLIIRFSSQRRFRRPPTRCQNQRGPGPCRC
jgi:hypothetical protein